MSAEMNLDNEGNYTPEEINSFLEEYERLLRQEGERASRECDPLCHIIYVSFVSRREFGKERKRPKQIELIKTTRDNGLHAVKRDWALYLDELATHTPGFEDNPIGLLNELRHRSQVNRGIKF